MADIAFKGMCSYIKDRLDNRILFTLAHLQQRALAQEGRSKDVKEGHRSGRHNLHHVEYDPDSSSSSDGGPSEVYAAEFIWPPKAKFY